MRSDDPIVIIGAGLAGLTAARYLREHGQSVRVFEASKNIAGLCRSEFDEEGFTYDCGAHFINSRLAAALGISSTCQPMPHYEEVFHYRGRNYKYPLGLLSSPSFVASAAKARLFGLVGKRPTTVAEAFRRSMGQAIANKLALPLVEAWSGESRDKLSPAIAEKFSTTPWQAFRLGIASRFSKHTVAIGYSHEVPESPHVHFVYPDGGVGAVCEAMATEISDLIETESRVERIVISDNRVTGVFVNGEFIFASAVVSTAPVHILSKLVEGTDRLSSLSEFKYRPMVFVNLKFNRPNVMEQVVTWTPEQKYTFFRISDIGRALPWLVPEGKNQITCDIGCEIGDDTWNADPSQLASHCLSQVEQIVPGISEHYLGFHHRRTPNAYPVFKSSYEATRLGWELGTGIEGLVSVGRNGEFRHILMEDVYWRTRRACAELIVRNKSAEGMASQ